jgi:hypothetical protein
MNKMAEFLAYRILSDKLNFSKIPNVLKEEVKAILVDLGYGELAE